MFGKRLKLFRLRRGLTRKALAELCNVSAMSVSHYEFGERTPTAEHAALLANALGVKLSDLLGGNSDVSFSHGCFRRNVRLSKSKQECVRAAIEDYFGRFYAVTDCLGSAVLPDIPDFGSLDFTGDAESDAKVLREKLGLSLFGPVGNVVEFLENNGFLLYAVDFDDHDFSGINGLANGRPYIAFNGNMSPERVRSTIVHELVHVMFKRPESEDNAFESYVMAVSGAFLFPKADVLRELGVKRKAVTSDMYMVCAEYGISMYLLVKRAEQCGVLSNAEAKKFYVSSGRLGWRTAEPSRIEQEMPQLFEQLTYRAINEDEISLQKGVELLQLPFEQVAENCIAAAR